MRFKAVMAAAALLAAAGAGAGAAPAPAPRPRVEVAFVLDSTGSMGGLIEGAKQKIWSIANGIIARRPTPQVRIGLVGYRDRGDEYVTRRLDLTDDIDAVFKALTALRADGGGDDEESVNQALSEAVRSMTWSPSGDVLRIIFLVGDYPPHMDYRDDVKYPETCREAVRRGIIVNTVQCGEVAGTAAVWREIARLSEGSYVALEQSGNMTSVATPFDDEITRVSAAIGATVVAYGRTEEREAAREKSAAAAAAPASVTADRAEYNLASGGRAIQGAGDLVTDFKEGRADLSKLRAEELPAEMAGMSAAERSAYLARRQVLRDSLNARLQKLVVDRGAYLARTAGAARDSFDAAVGSMISEEAARAR
jgi:hypothetical protein